MGKCRTPGRGATLVLEISMSRASPSAMAATASRITTGAAQLERLIYPAGLDMGHVSDEEIALSILAQILMHRNTRESIAAPLPETHRNFQPTAAPAEAVDPICDMVVAITPTALRADFEGTTYYFCGEGCRRRFLKDPATAVAATR